MEKYNNWKLKFYTIWAGQAVSLITSAILQMAIIFYLTEKTGSAMVLSMASLVGFLPYAVFGPAIGVLVDRHDRKKIMIGADLIIAAAGAVLAIVALYMELPIWMVMVLLSRKHQEKRKERKIKGDDFPVAGRHLSGLCQSGPPGFPARFRMARHADNDGCPLLLCGIYLHDNRFYDHPLVPDQPQAHPEVCDKVDCGDLHCAYRNGAARLFFFRSVLDAVPVRHALRSGRRLGGRGAESLCSQPLFFAGDEFSSLFLRSGGSHQPEHHGARPQVRPLE